MKLFQVKSILSEYKIHNADITLRYDATADDLIDVVEGNRTYIPCIYLLNKIDQISIEVKSKIQYFIRQVLVVTYLL
jgi:ribosome-interacting GTPase 1